MCHDFIARKLLKLPWRRTNHMDCWMDGQSYLGPARPGGYRPASPPTLFPTWFPMDFPMHFGMDLASIWDPFLMTFPSFGTDISITEFRNPQTMENSIITWDSSNKNREITCSDFPSILYQILDPFRHRFGSLFACFLKFLWRRISDAFSDAFFFGFWHQSGTRMASKMDKKSAKNGKLGSPVQLRRSRLDFGSIVVPLVWSPFGTPVIRFGHLWGYLLVHFGIFWSRDWPGHLPIFRLRFTLITSGFLT